MSLRKKAFSGVKWTTASSFVNTIVQFTQTVILARLLLPDDFGLVGMVSIVIGFSQMFSDAGISAAIIHHQEISHKQLSSLYWANIFSGILIFIIVLLVSPTIVLFFDDNRLQSLLILASIIFLIIPVGQQFQVLFQKELDFKRISTIEISSTIIGAALAILIAAKGWGAASIIYGQIANATTKSLQYLYFGLKFHKPLFHFSRSDLKGFIGFGLYQMGEKSINYFNSRIDQLLIGKLLGATELGYYTLAYNLVLQPIYRINPIINRVAFPVYAKIQNDLEKLKRGFFQTLKYMTLVNFPILVGLALVAEHFVLAIYGEKWIPSILLIQILAFMAIIRSIGNPIGSLLLAKGRVDLGFKWNLFLFFITPTIVYMSSFFGIYVIAISLLIAQIIYLFISYQLMIKPLLGNCFREWFVYSFIKPLIFSFSMGFFVLMFISFTKYTNYLTLVYSVLIGSLSYIFILLIFERKTLINFKQLLSN